MPRPAPSSRCSIPGAGTPPAAPEAQRRIVVVHVGTQSITAIASGPLHRPRLSSDGRTLTYWRESPPITHMPATSFFGPNARGEAAYDAVNWGSETHHVDVATGAAIARTGQASLQTNAPQPTLQVTNTPADGTRLVLVRPGRSDIEVWRGNAWVKEVALGRPEAIPYTSASDTGADRDGSFTHLVTLLVRVFRR